MELLLLLTTAFTGFITIMAIMKIFTISHNIEIIKKTMADFTQYYYKLNEYKLSNTGNTVGNTGAVKQ